MAGSLAGGSAYPWIDALEDQLQEMITNIEDNNIQVDVVIPVIVHIVHETGEPNDTGNNIPESRVTKAIDDLNFFFMNTGIQFCKAKRYQNGTPLTEHGIVRVNASSISGYSSSGMTLGGQSEFEIKNLGDQFSNYNYLNIWTVKKIQGLDPNSVGEVRGFASFPLRTDATLDGIVMDVDYFGIVDNRILTHEAGHYFSLYHSFNGDDLDFDGFPEACPSGDPGEGDMVDDTDPHKRSLSTTCPSGDNECNTGSDLQNIVHNHMNYSDELCRDYFSTDQVTRMQASLLAFRPGLVDALSCKEGCQMTENVDFTTNPTNPIASDGSGNDGEIAEFNGLAGPMVVYEWYINGVITTDSDNMESKLSYLFSETGKYTVCMRVLKDGCEIEKCKDVVVFSAGLCKAPVLDPCEKIVNGTFDESYPESEYHYEAENHTHWRPIFNTGGDMTFYDKICGWNNALHFLGICQWNDLSGFFYSIIDGNNRAGGLRSSVELDLIPGVTYEGSIDLAIKYNYVMAAKAPEIYLALIDQDFITTNPFGGDFDHSNVQPKKIHSIFLDEMITFPNTIDDLAKSDFNTYKFEFTYDASMSKYLFVSEHGPEFGTSTADVFIDNISISECPAVCAPEPEINVTQIDNCTFAFEGLNEPAEGIMYWSIESGPSNIVADNTTFSFAIPGIYEVCLNIVCSDGTFEQKCISVDATACDRACGGQVAYIADLMKLCDDEGYRGNVPISVDPGFYPCNEGSLTIIPVANNAPVISSHYYFDDSGITPVLNLSLFFEDEPSGGYSVILCGPDGTSQCFMFGVQNNIDECKDCVTVPMTFPATCIDQDNTDNTFIYNGTFSITPDPGSIPCGSSVSTEAGFDIISESSSGGQWNYDFTIFTNNPNSFNTETTICFDGASGKKCYTVVIDVPEPCEVDDGECEYQTNSVSYECNKSSSADGSASFTFRYFVSEDMVPEILQGYTLCDNGITISNGDFESPPISILTPQGDGYIIAINFEMTCERLSQIGSTELRIEFCDASGKPVCLSVDIPLYCEACNHDKSKGRDELGMDKNYQIYPNPTSNVITIVSSTFTDVQEYQLFDINGSLIYKDILSEKETSLSLERLQSGVYFLQIKNGASIFNKRVIKL